MLTGWLIVVIIAIVYIVDEMTFYLPTATEIPLISGESTMVYRKEIVIMHCCVIFNKLYYFR
jgi:hypothetical protein